MPCWKRVPLFSVGLIPRKALLLLTIDWRPAAPVRRLNGFPRCFQTRFGRHRLVVPYSELLVQGQSAVADVVDWIASETWEYSRPKLSFVLTRESL